MPQKKLNPNPGGGQLTFHPATKSRWKDLELLFGERGACAGCWCMWWRLARPDFEKGKGTANRKQLKNLVESKGHAPGILAYSGKQAIGWCSVGPRKEFVRFETSRTLKPIDSKPVWSVVCLFVDKNHRRNGVAYALLGAAAEYAFSQGADVVEGYPVVPRNETMPDTFAYTGVPSAFKAAGFKVVKKSTAARWIVRKER